LQKSDDEKANIYAINGFRQPDSDIQHLKDVYECNPKSTLVGALLIREVNKLEQNLLQQQPMSLDGFNAFITDNNWDINDKDEDSLKIANLKHLKVVRDFAIRLAAEKKYGEPNFGYITAAYLSWIENNDGLALRYLKRINLEKLSKGLKDQYRITELLIKANQLKKGMNFNENELIPTLKWLDEKRFAENKELPIENEYYVYLWNEGKENKFTLTARNFYQQVLAPSYAKLGDTTKAALAMLKGDLRFRLLKKNRFENLFSYQTSIYWHQSLSENTLAKIAFYKARPITNELVGFLSMGLNQLNDDDFYELQGTSYLRAHQYAKALQCFNKLSKTYKYWTPKEWVETDGKYVPHKRYANAFIETIVDDPKLYAVKPNGLNKKTFAQRMLKLQSLTKTDKKNAQFYYYEMANALYQTGEFGNAWFFISYDSKVYRNTKRSIYNYNNDYKLALKAKEYYAKARTLSKDPNFKAKCTFMLARCEEKEAEERYDDYRIKWTSTEDYNRQQKERSMTYEEMTVSNKYFKELKNEYATTSFYKVAVSECSYFRDFLKASR
jgi:hypothetical protein